MSDLKQINEKLRRENEELQAKIKEIEESRAAEAESAKLTAENIALREKLASLTKTAKHARDAPEKQEPPRKKAPFNCNKCGVGMLHKGKARVWNSRTGQHDFVESSDCQSCRDSSVFLC